MQRGFLKTARSAFSLVELLVVITIIGVLVAMFLPSLEKAKHEARVSVCASLQHQNVVAIISYSTDSKQYFPRFGGEPVDIGAGRFGNTVSPFMRPADPIWSLYFNEYCKTEKARLCPVVNWYQFGAYTFINPGITWYPNGALGYNYYTGRKMYGSGAGDDMDSLLRREDPLELLITDQMAEAANFQVEDHGWAGTFVDGPGVPWFNPHNNRSATRTRGGQAYEGLADGSVRSIDFGRESYPGPIIRTSGWVAMCWAAAEMKGPPSSMENGIYYAWTDH